MLAPFLLFRDRLPLVFPRRIDAREEDLGRGCGSRARGNGCSASLAFLHGRASERVGEADRRCNRFPGHYSGGLAAYCGPLPSRAPSPRPHPLFLASPAPSLLPFSAAAPGCMASSVRCLRRKHRRTHDRHGTECQGTHAAQALHWCSLLVGHLPG